MNTVVQLNIQVSQGSAATYLRRGGMCHSVFFCSSSRNATVKELLKSIHVRQSYHKKTAWVFFWLTVYRSANFTTSCNLINANRNNRSAHTFNMHSKQWCTQRGVWRLKPINEIFFRTEIITQYCTKLRSSSRLCAGLSLVHFVRRRPSRTNSEAWPVATSVCWRHPDIRLMFAITRWWILNESIWVR